MLSPLFPCYVPRRLRLPEARGKRDDAPNAQQDSLPSSSKPASSKRPTAAFFSLLLFSSFHFASGLLASFISLRQLATGARALSLPACSPCFLPCRVFDAIHAIGLSLPRSVQSPPLRPVRSADSQIQPICSSIYLVHPLIIILIILILTLIRRRMRLHTHTPLTIPPHLTFNQSPCRKFS